MGLVALFILSGMAIAVALAIYALYRVEAMWARAVLIAFFLFLSAFCGYGFLATFEPWPTALAWRTGYALVGIAAFAAMGWQITKLVSRH